MGDEGALVPQEDLEGFEVEEGLELLRSHGESPEVDDAHGIWASSAERERWLAFTKESETTGAAALGLYLLGDRALAAVSDFTRLSRIAEEEWDENCFVCGDGGNLICCDHCPHTVHTQCVGLAKVPKGDFSCFYCERDAQGRRDRGEADKKGGKGGDKKGGKGDRKGEKRSGDSEGDGRKGGSGGRRGGKERSSRGKDKDEGSHTRYCSRSLSLSRSLPLSLSRSLSLSLSLYLALSLSRSLSYTHTHTHT